jgi:hypothetical protein
LKKTTIITLFFVLLFVFVTRGSFAQDSLHWRIISGAENSEKIRVFYWWNDPIAPTSIEAYKFNNNLAAWQPVDISLESDLLGVYKFIFNSSGGITIEGYVPPNLGGTLYEEIYSLDDLLLFSDDPKTDMATIKKKIRRYLRDLGMRWNESLLTIYLGLNTEGYERVDTSYQTTFPGMSLVAVIPTNADGKLDAANISSGDKGISLLWNLPHFIILVPSQ